MIHDGPGATPTRATFPPSTSASSSPAPSERFFKNTRSFSGLASLAPKEVKRRMEVEEGNAGGGAGWVGGGTYAPVGSLSRPAARASIMLAKSLALLGPASPLAGAWRSRMNGSRRDTARERERFSRKQTQARQAIAELIKSSQPSHGVRTLPWGLAVKLTSNP